MPARFKKLTLNECANLLWKEGKFLTTSTYYNRKVNLYSMNGHFVEVWYDVAGNLIEKIIPMSKPNLFRKYLEQN